MARIGREIKVGMDVHCYDYLHFGSFLTFYPSGNDFQRPFFSLPPFLSPLSFLLDASEQLFVDVLPLLSLNP
jgi:hypothetical protein